MKREIKFRGKDFLGRWHYGYLHLATGSSSLMIQVDSFDSFGVLPESVGQFTGLLDKNGKEIYEVDIIGCHNPSINHLIFYNEKQGRFMAALNGDIENDFGGVCGLDDSRWTGSKKVIGNVYDNPELLKAEHYETRRRNHASVL